MDCFCMILKQRFMTTRKARKLARFIDYYMPVVIISIIFVYSVVVFTIALVNLFLDINGYSVIDYNVIGIITMSSVLLMIVVKITSCIIRSFIRSRYHF